MNKEQRVGVIDEFRKQKNNTVHFVTFTLTLAVCIPILAYYVFGDTELTYF